MMGSTKALGAQGIVCVQNWVQEQGQGSIQNRH